MKKESFDGKLFTLLLLKKWKTVFVVTILAALIVGVPYTLSKTVMGTFDYRCELTVHLEYGEDSSGQMYDYINFYTWNQWITSDKYIDALMSKYNFSSMCTKEDIRDALGAEVRADQRVVVFTIDTNNPKKTSVIGAAVWDSLKEFIMAIPEVKSVEIITITEPFRYFVYKSIPQAFVFGGILGFFLSIFCIWLASLLDDSVYIPELFERDYKVTLADEKSENELLVERERPTIPDCEELSLCIECGAHNGKAVGYVFHECEKRGITIKSVRLSNVDEKLVKAYYMGSKFPNPFLKDE